MYGELAALLKADSCKDVVSLLLDWPASDMLRPSVTQEGLVDAANKAQSRLVTAVDSRGIMAYCLLFNFVCPKCTRGSNACVFVYAYKRMVAWTLAQVSAAAWHYDGPPSGPEWPNNSAYFVIMINDRFIGAFHMPLHIKSPADRGTSCHV